ncbi:MAG: hypothetical protein KAR79_06150, partial [Simkaniaceae bacterium]|nr:hypothetical protein [Simkaniaceae bacterium]
MAAVSSEVNYPDWMVAHCDYLDTLIEGRSENKVLERAMLQTVKSIKKRLEVYSPFLEFQSKISSYDNETDFFQKVFASANIQVIDLQGKCGALQKKFQETGKLGLSPEKVKELGERMAEASMNVVALKGDINSLQLFLSIADAETKRQIPVSNSTTQESSQVEGCLSMLHTGNEGIDRVLGNCPEDFFTEDKLKFQVWSLLGCPSGIDPSRLNLLENKEKIPDALRNICREKARGLSLEDQNRLDGFVYEFTLQKYVELGKELDTFGDSNWGRNHRYD